MIHWYARARVTLSLFPQIFFPFRPLAWPTELMAGDRAIPL